ncbi:MAG TPA: hypothetical protein VNO50_11040 [Pyrinomonadaceae bacterium]|nr:hypothetical protein [Pyrinomonadaceae bacterium]
MDEKAKQYIFVVLGGIALVILTGLLWYNWPGQVSRRVCYEAVRERLRSPSTAQFGPSEYEGTGISSPKYEVRGWVDAANAYGTPIRNYYLCMVENGTDIEVHLSETKFASYHERLRQGRGPI